MTTSKKTTGDQTAPPVVKESAADNREKVVAGDAGTIKDRLLSVFKRMTKRA
jgi:hypothetical protein